MGQSNSSNSSCDESDRFNNSEWIAHQLLTLKIVGYIELGYFCVGTPANLCVLVICSSVACTARNRNSNQWFILSMAFADLLATMIHSPLIYLQYARRVRLNQAECVTFYLTTYISAIGSSLSLLCLNIDKFIFLHRPLHYQLIVTRKKVFIAILCCWLLTVTLAAFLYFGPLTEKIDHCEFRPSHVGLYYTMFVLCFLVPTAACMVISALVAIIVIRASQSRESRRSVVSQSAQSTKGIARERTFKRLRSLVFVFSTTVWSACTVLPYRVAYIVYVSNECLRGDRSLATAFLYLVAVLAANPVGNPFITVLTQRQYLKKFRDIMNGTFFFRLAKQKGSVDSRAQMGITALPSEATLGALGSCKSRNISTSSSVIGKKSVRINETKY